MNKLKKPNDTMKAIEIVKFGGPENLKLKLRNIPKLKKGEILGLYGLVGAGRTELIKCLLGLDKINSGQILLNNKEI